MEKITIIGGGITGLTMAIILKKLGIDFHIYEKSEKPSTHGAGIMLANNAMQIYQKLGIEKEILNRGNIISEIQLTNEAFIPNSITHLQIFEQKFGVTNISIHRSDLQTILINRIGVEHISYGKEIINLDTDLCICYFQDGTTINYSHLIGTDGIYSKIRQFIFPNTEIISANQIAWRGISHIILPEKYKHVTLEAWTAGARFGMNRINENQSYWFAVANKPIGATIDVNSVGKKFPKLAQQLITSTRKESIYFDEIKEISKLKNWNKKSIVLLGDAAHAMTPNLGQGACQAIEDCYTLGELLKIETIDTAFSKLYKIRNNKVYFIKNKSRQLGKMAHWENTVCIAMRNVAMRLIPNKINNRIVEKLFQLDNKNKTLSE